MHTIYKAPQASLLDNIKADLLEGRSVRLQAKGWSMLPMIWDERDTLVLAPISREQLKVGMIVFAQTGSGRYIIHRIAHIVGTRIELRGDGNPYQEEYVHPQTVFGELVEVQQKNRCLRKGDWRWRAYALLWPKNGNIRRILLFFYRRLFLR